MEQEDRNGEFSGAPATLPTNSQVRVEDEEQPPRRGTRVLSNRVRNFSSADNEGGFIRDDALTCITMVFTFWFLVSTTLILGVYGSVYLRLGPNSSLLIKTSPLFVEYLKVEELDETKPGSMLYGFHKDPPLDVVNTWSETHGTSLGASSHEEWLYVLNEGSHINVSYSVSPSSSSVVFIIAEGSDGLAQWLENPSYPNTTLSWNIINGNGMIQQVISKSSSYYIAVGNLYGSEVVVQLNVEIKAFLYNTTKAYYMCNLARGQCALKLFLPSRNAALITSPGSKNDTTKDEWYVKLSYGPRWITYVVGIGGLTVFMLLAFQIFIDFPCTRDNRDRAQYGDQGSERESLLLQKDDDLSSWGSSYDFVSQDDESPEDSLAMSSLEGKGTNSCEYNNNARSLCAICFDAPRNCFFLPCGHCVACFACGTRIAEECGTCPICRRNIKKVRKIITV